MNNIIEAFASEQLKNEIPSFNVGDTVRVHNRIKEGNRERIQMFEGTVIAKRNGGIGETFTVKPSAEKMPCHSGSSSYMPSASGRPITPRVPSAAGRLVR